MGLIRKSWEPCPHTSAIRPRLPLVLLVKSQYQAETGRAVERGALFFQIRQAFPPGEVTAEGG